MTPLHLAVVWNGDPAVAGLLIGAGADLEARAEFWWTPLHVAASENVNSEVVELLLDRGADPTAQDTLGRTAWNLIQDNDALTGTDAYGRLRDLSSECVGWNTAEFLGTATVSDVTRCLAEGHAADEQDETGLTPLHMTAAWNGDPAVAELLIEAGAELGAPVEGSVTPLHLAVVLNRNPAVVALLVDQGANLEAPADLGMTPLHFAVGWNLDPAIAGLLIEAGSKLEAQTELGWTPLHVAAVHSVNSEVVELLLDRGADPTAQDGIGKTAWDLIEDNDALTGTDAYWRLSDLLSD